MQYETPLLIWTDGRATQQEIERLWQQQTAIDDLLEGRATPLEVLDLLSEGDIDIETYVDSVESAIDRVIAEEIPVEDGALLLQLRGDL